MRYDEEPHSGIYFRKYRGNKAISGGLELLFDTVEKAAEYLKEEYTFEQDTSYHIEDTYGRCYAIVTKGEIKYL